MNNEEKPRTTFEVQLLELLDSIAQSLNSIATDVSIIANFVEKYWEKIR